jgi:Tc toxin complex TcA C-terminal TcB-binding domain
LALATKQYAWREADWQVQALDMSKQGAQARLRCYQQLLAAGLIAGETAYQALTGVAIGDHSSANITEAIGQAMEYIPDIAAGVAGLGPYLSTQMPIGSKLAGTFSAVARIINTEAEMATTNGSLELTQAGWDRRVADWQLQVETIGIEIDQIQLQSLAAQRHRDMALRDLNEQQQQIEHAVEVQDFRRDKFTSSELYLYLRQETAALHRRMYDLALHTARQAQRAYNYERGHTARRFLPESGWDDLQAGLLAGERLHLALRQMEGAYLDLNCREYELTKHLSLRLDLPLAYLHLQQAGWAEIEIPEWMFDLDYPGQYLRRIKNVSLTIPCVVGPYTGVHCRLTLLSSATQVDPRLADPLQRCCDERRDQAGGRADGCGCGCEADQPQDGYLARPADPRIVRDYAAAEAIATSSGQNDSGTFELNFRDERYLPFEFAGAVSRWRIELPPTCHGTVRCRSPAPTCSSSSTIPAAGRVTRCASLPSTPSMAPAASAAARVRTSSAWPAPNGRSSITGCSTARSRRFAAAVPATWASCASRPGPAGSGGCSSAAVMRHGD